MRLSFSFFILFGILPLVGVKAQVNVYYDDIITGRMSLEKLANIQVVSFVEVTIDYRYRGLVLDEKGNELIRMESGVISQKPGIKEMSYDQLPELQVLRQQVALESYSGEITLQSMLVHPLDTTSIIAMDTRTLRLMNGVVVDENGKPKGDPREVDFFLQLHEGTFELDRLYEEAVFQNNNEVEICLPLYYQIVQSGETIYEARIESLCLPPGNSKLTDLPGAEPEIFRNSYEDRSAEEAIQLLYQLGDRLSGNKRFGPFKHAPQPLEYQRYEHQPSGISFSFPAGATQPFFPAPEDGLVIFNAANEVESIELLKFPSNPGGILGMQEPFHLILRREGFNGGVNLSVFDKDNFSDAQWKGYLAFVNGVTPAEIQLLQRGDCQFLLPPRQTHERKKAGSPIGHEVFSFGIMEKDWVIVLELFVRKTYGSLPFDQPVMQGTLDLTQVLSSLTFHGAPLEFTFEDEELQEVTCNPSASAPERQAIFNRFREYRWLTAQRHLSSSLGNVMSRSGIDFEKLEELRKSQDELEAAAFPRYQVSTVEDQASLDYRPFVWDSMNVQVTFRHGEEEPQIATQTIFEDYFYNQEGAVGAWSQSTGGEPNPNLEFDFGGYLRVQPTSLDLRPHFLQTITLARWEKTEESDSILRSIADYENGLHYSPEGAIRVEKSSGWTIYAAPFLRNSVRQTNCLMVDAGQYVYRLKITGGFKYDYVRLLEDLRIEGKKLHLEYQDDRLVNIQLTD